MEMKLSTVNSYCQPTPRKKLAFRILTIVTMKTLSNMIETLKSSDSRCTWESLPGIRLTVLALKSFVLLHFIYFII